MKRFVYILENLSSANLADILEQEISRLEDLKNVQLDFATSALRFETTNPPEAEINRIIRKYDKGINLVECRNDKISDPELRLIYFFNLIAALIFLVIAIFQKGTAAVFLYYASYIVLIWRFSWKTIRLVIKKKRLTLNFAAIIFSFISLMAGKEIEAMAIIAIFQAGRWLQQVTLSFTKTPIGICPLSQDYVKCLKGKDYVMKKVLDIVVGDKILLVRGNKVVVDSIINQGFGYFDSSLINGNKIPNFRGEGDLVLAGEVLINNAVVAEAIKTIANSQVAMINSLADVEREKKKQKDSIYQVIEKLYLFCLATAILIIVSLTLFQATKWHWFKDHLTDILLVSLPSGMILLWPLIQIIFLKQLAKKGLFAKKGTIIEELAKTRQLIVDKDSNLLNGQMTMIELKLKGDNLKALRLVAALESLLALPLINVKKFWQVDCRGLVVTDYLEEPGLGCVGTINKQRIWLGNKGLMNKYQLSYPDLTGKGRIFYLAIDAKVIGWFILQEEIKEDSAIWWNKLQQSGMELILISGENQNALNQLAKFFPASIIYGEALPEEKLALCKKIKQKGKTIYLGGGLGDLPAISAADIGLSVCNSHPLVREFADAGLSDEDISKIPSYIIFCRQKSDIVKFDIVVALIIKMVLIVLVALDFLEVWQAVLIDIAVVLFACLSALMPTSQKKGKIN